MMFDNEMVTLPLPQITRDKMDPKDRDVAYEYALELHALSNSASLDWADGTGGNVTLHFRDAATISIYLRNALHTISVLEKELSEANGKVDSALRKLGAMTLASERE